MVQGQKIFFLGLGNPGSKYDLQRHNVGKDYILSLAKDLKAPITTNKNTLASTFELGRTGALSPVMIISIFILLIATVMFIVFMERAMRKILVNYPKRQMGNKIYGGESSYLPLKINTAGVIPAIFASALLLLPITFSNFGVSESDFFINFSSLLTS